MPSHGLTKISILVFWLACLSSCRVQLRQTCRGLRSSNWNSTISRPFRSPVEHPCPPRSGPEASNSGMAGAPLLPVWDPWAETASTRDSMTLSTSTLDTLAPSSATSPLVIQSSLQPCYPYAPSYCSPQTGVSEVEATSSATLMRTTVTNVPWSSTDSVAYNPVTVVTLSLLSLYCEYVYQSASSVSSTPVTTDSFDSLRQSFNTAQFEQVRFPWGVFIYIFLCFCKVH